MMIETRFMWRLSFWAVLATGCTSPNPRSCLDDFCEDPNLPFCDSDGAVSGEPGTCVAVECQPFAFETCRGNEALICNAAGDNYDITNCDLGCGDNGCIPCEPGSPECPLPVNHIEPHFLPGVCDELTTAPAFIVSTDTTLDTSMSNLCTGGVVATNSGLEICIIRARSMTVDSTTTLKVVGERAIAFVTDDTVRIDGILDASADMYISGPGGGHRPSGANTGAPGFATNGGAGTHPEAVTGPATSDPADGTDLVAGASAARTIPSAYSGGGGGAVLFASCRADVIVSGMIDAGGGGGYGAQLATMSSPGKVAGGGGAGGYVVIQGMHVEVTGEIYANGGGGGGGFPVLNQPSANGSDGLRTTNLNSSAGARGGGNGGQEGSMPTAGTRVDNAYGAGGGSMGMTQIFTPPNAPPSTNGAMVSPAFRPHRTVTTK